MTTDPIYNGMMCWTTRGVSPRDRLTYWNNLTSECFVPMSIDGDRFRFRGDLARLRLGEITLARVHSTPSQVFHTSNHIMMNGDTSEYMLLRLQLSGRSMNRQAGSEIELQPGDLMLVDPTQTYDFEFDAESKFIICRFPAEEMRNCLPQVRNLVGCHISGQRGASRILRSLLDALWDEGHAESDTQWMSGAGECIYRAVELAYGEIRNERSSSVSSNAMFERASRHIREHLADPALNVTSMADALGVTSRYVQKSFAEAGTTPSESIAQQRIEAAKRMLVGSDKSVTEIAFDVGFNDVSHFGRTFRRHAGTTPSRFRRPVS